MAYKQEFAEAVRDAIGERTYRQVARESGLSPAYIADMVQGRVPKRDAVIAFALATGASIDDLLQIAGYEPDEASYAQAFAVLYRQMKERLAADGIPTMDKGSAFGGTDGLTAADAAAEIAELERLLRKHSGK